MSEAASPPRYPRLQRVGAFEVLTVSPAYLNTTAASRHGIETTGRALPRPRATERMDEPPDDCPEHVWASVGVAVVDGTVTRVWTCERCTGWTGEPLEAERRVAWERTALSE